jgi:hypothetical protein
MASADDTDCELPDLVVHIEVDTTRLREAFYADGIGPTERRLGPPSISAEPTESLEGFEDDPSDDEPADDNDDPYANDHDIGHIAFGNY